ncbi:MAG: hypothetical protein WEB06_08880 [Actinomycetota bacterium]
MKRTVTGRTVEIGEGSDRRSSWGARVGLVVVSTIIAAGALAVKPNPASAAFPGPNGLIAFSRDVAGGAFDIFTVTPDGTSEVRLTDDPGFDVDPAWNADGTKIAFASDRGGDLDIWVMNADGSASSRLTDALGIDNHPTWSPDGSRIAFHSNRDGNDEIYVMNADGSGQTNISNDPGNSDGSPAWSPDGTRIAFSRSGSIRSMQPDGSGQTTITSGGFDLSPDWSPDGTRIVFSRLVGDTFDLFLVESAGSEPTNITDGSTGDAREPAWSPDNSRIVFDSFRPGQGLVVQTVRIDGSDLRTISAGIGPNWARGPDVVLGSCSDTANPDGDEAGAVSGPIHRALEPRIGALGPVVHGLNCRLISPLQL